MGNFKSSEPCCACGESRDNFVTYHHLLTQKSAPEYKHEKWNLMPLCQLHHNQIHQWGKKSFSEKYRGAKNWLEKHGWSINDFGKWVKP